jgi:hypothetical protein
MEHINDMFQRLKLMCVGIYPNSPFLQECTNFRKMCTMNSSLFQRFCNHGNNYLFKSLVDIETNKISQFSAFKTPALCDYRK